MVSEELLYRTLFIPINSLFNHFCWDLLIIYSFNDQEYFKILILTTINWEQLTLVIRCDNNSLDAHRYTHLIYKMLYADIFSSGTCQTI